MPQTDATLREATDTRAIPGVVAIAATADGRVLYQGAFGRRDLSTDAAMTPDTVFWIASMTKAVTSLAALQLVEQGRLDLDAPLGRLLPALAEPQVLEGFEESGAPRLRSARRPVTLRALLTHTAGFGYDIWSEPLCRYAECAGLPGIISCRDAALRMPLLFDPGERWGYGIGIDFVGKAVEAASGIPLDDYLRERVLGPLGMDDTGFRISPDQRARLARMHQRGEDGSLTPIDFELPQEPEFFMGGGGLYGTAPDYLRFLRLVLNGGALDGVRLLRPETAREMTRDQLGGLRVTALRTAMPPVSRDAEFFPGLPRGWSLGFQVNLAPAPTGRGAGGLAWAGLGNTYFWLDPAKRVAGVILMQLLPFADPRALDLFAAFEKDVYDRL
jgi:CubicO group peptidase (beta-lactamase class C family)